MYNQNQTLLREVTNDGQSKQGWICPKCQNVIAPTIHICPKCEKNINESITDNKQILNG